MDKKELIINNKLDELSKSKFRSSFHLRKYMREYIKEKGYKELSQHAYDILNKNIRPAYPKNDGKQTPMKNHPVFIAQHATATCCRGCIEKWYHIPKEKVLQENEIKCIKAMIMEWIKKEYTTKKEQ